MRIPDSPPIIKPLPEGTERPLWSVMIPVYNCAYYLPELLNSLLTQDMVIEDMQIEVVDDCSTDADVRKIVCEIGKGRVSYYRQSENVGSLRNFETCINRSRGKYIHLLHGDDKLLPGFYKEMTAVFEQFPEAGAAFCKHQHINYDGTPKYNEVSENTGPYIPDNWLETLAEKQRLQYVAVVVKRSVYEHLGAFYGVIYGEDWEMWARIAKHYPMATNPKILAQYRQHIESISGTCYKTGRNLRDITKVIDTINTYLPAEKRKHLKYIARKNYAYFAFARKSSLWKRNHSHQPGIRYFMAILKMHTDTRLVVKIIRLTMSISFYNFKQLFRHSKP